jgi:hypothetical protein
MPPKVSLSPSLDEIQECINQSAQAILSLQDCRRLGLPRHARGAPRLAHLLREDHQGH